VWVISTIVQVSAMVVVLDQLDAIDRPDDVDDLHRRQLDQR